MPEEIYFLVLILQTIIRTRNNKTNKNSAGRFITENWNTYTNPSWYDSIIEGIRRPFVILSLGPFAIVKSIREIPTILLMNWAFRKGLMEFGVYKCRG